ncbi:MULTISPECIES: carbohydrate ABC transporter permease [unclassified Isoptericola]|uniref:carbohydrate ABC transporter permease n=1 Tax=unclassified Isoptericola TaxID=2623355 RepID=UPI002712BCC4|nr:MULTISPECIES: sugar ABC transporter permease [unclassified Isoptericola]MDO8145860.1 sugar ABC transporter permease [Isoptericola sp. 178]MDO8147806.1 sugar ABC transporter permease [Isoptericola sp. b515]
MTTTGPAATAARTTRGAPARRRRSSHGGAVAVLVSPFLVLFALFYLAPIAYAAYRSFFVVEREGTFGAATEVFGGFAQYRQVFENDAFWASLGRVLLFGVVQVPVMLGIALLLALLIDSTLVKGKRFYRLAFFAPYAVPSVIAAIMWGFLYSPSLSPFEVVTSNVDLLGSSLVLWSIANVVTWVYIGYNMLIIYSALQAIPQDIYEAARIDGAGQLRIALSVKIPLVIPALVLTGVFSIIGTLQLLTEPQVFRTFTTSVSSTFTPNLLVYTTSTVPNFNLAAAFSVVLALLTFVLSFVFLRLTQRRAFQ